MNQLAADDLTSLRVDELVLSAAAGLARLGYAKLEAKDLAETKLAIDALQSLLPHVGGDHARDHQGALTGLQDAFVTASSS